MSHILVIDDDSSIGEVMNIILEDLGHSATVIPSFNDLQKIKSFSADLILLDGNIGMTSGKEIGKYLHSHPHLNSTPVIIFSADDSAEQIAEDIHAQGVLKKPFEIEKLSEIINTFSSQ